MRTEEAGEEQTLSRRAGPRHECRQAGIGLNMCPGLNPRVRIVNIQDMTQVRCGTQAQIISLQPSYPGPRICVRALDMVGDPG